MSSPSVNSGRHVKTRAGARGALVSLAFGVASAALASGSTCTGPAVSLPPVCGTTLPAPTISCAIPTDVAGRLAQPQAYLAQRASNLFSWQLFIGMHWPASATRRGEPEPSLALGAPGKVVWETWREAREVFRHDPSGKPMPPLPWNEPSAVPAQCAGSERVLHRLSKVDDLLDDFDQPTGANRALPPVLTAQNGKPTRYEIRLNRIAYEAIAAPGNRWWDGARHADLKSVRFPAGSILVKAAWTPVDEADAKRFHTINACVCDHDVCTVQRMGLSGFHVMSKTPSAPQWLWSTFEHMGNVPDSCTAPAAGRYTYFDASKGMQKANRQTPAGTPSQVCRLIPIPSAEPLCVSKEDASDNVQALNAAMQKALASTPIARYALINTQWPVPGRTPAGAPHTVFAVQPALLGNSALESFIQGSSSCMGCHSMARTKRHASTAASDRGFVSSDFTFALGLARPKLAPLPLLRELPAADCAGDKAADPKCRALQIVNDTYNQLPEHVGAKLHCSSCHLDAGRNPRAAWWKGMAEKYSPKVYPGGLANRINHCFTNSLNGKKLCTPDENGLCPDNPHMSALIAYMAWLSEPRNNPTHAVAKHALVRIGSGTGVKERGAQIFLQKCAFCHGADGQGRYEDGVYFRPALWGDRSFNSRAGMEASASLAPFIYANMPLGSGGELTKQEAMDLACYIDSRPRPGGPPHPSGVKASGISCR